MRIDGPANVGTCTHQSGASSSIIWEHLLQKAIGTPPKHDKLLGNATRRPARVVYLGTLATENQHTASYRRESPSHPGHWAQSLAIESMSVARVRETSGSRNSWLSRRFCNRLSGTVLNIR